VSIQFSGDVPEMNNVIETYESVSVHEIERVLEFMKDAWILGFPVVVKEDGRGKKELLMHASLLLLIATGCISREQKSDGRIIAQIKNDIEKGGRLTLDAMDFLEQVRSPARYTREAVMARQKRSQV